MDGGIATGYKHERKVENNGVKTKELMESQRSQAVNWRRLAVDAGSSKEGTHTEG